MTPPASRLGLGGGFYVPSSDQLLAQEGDAAVTSRTRPLFSLDNDGVQVQPDEDSAADRNNKMAFVSCTVFDIRISIPFCYPLYVPRLCTQNIGHYVNCYHLDGSNRELRLEHERLQPEFGTVRTAGSTDSSRAGFPARPADKRFHTATGEPGWPDKPTTRGFCDFDRTDPLPAAIAGTEEHRAEQGTSPPRAKKFSSFSIATRLCSTTDTAICDVN